MSRENKSLKERNAAHQELLRHLRLMPEEHARGVLDYIRTAPKADPQLLLDAVRGAPRSPHPSAASTALALLPFTQSAVELSLCTRHPVVYPNLDLLAEHIDLKTIMQSSRLPDIAPILPLGPLPLEKQNLSLEDLSIGFWSPVSVTDEYARGAISLYLEIDHPTIGTFDAQLFIHDLLHLKFDFCSPFLVNALLALASQGYTIKDRMASARSLEFEREAEKLLDVENEDSLTTLAGLALLSYSHGAHGQQSDGSRRYAQRALQMAKRMKLFGVPDVIHHCDIQTLPRDHQRALKATAWGGFNTIMLLSFFYVVHPAAYPPALPHPECCTTSEDDVKSSKKPLNSSCAGCTVTSALCSLWTITSEVFCVYRGPDRPPVVATLAFAYTKYARLLVLADELSDQIVRNERTSLQALFFHIVYHSTILEMFRPLLSSAKIKVAKYTATSTPSPDTLFAASVQQLKSIVAECIQHQGATATVFWAGIGPMQIANAVLKDLQSPDWRYYFLFCIRCFELVYPAFAVCKGIVQGLLAMAVESNAITSSEALLIMEGFSQAGDFHSAIVGSRGAFVVDYDLALINMEEAAVDALVDRFQKIDVFEAYTNELL